MASVQYTNEQLQLAANTVRVLSAEGVEKANSGHPGMPMGAADYGVVLWLKYLRFNPSDPKWLNRDRFVLSNGHGSMFLYTMLHLAGYPISLDDLKSFRQWGSKTPGHPESFLTPGVECTTGPLGQGISNAVGIALGERLLATRYNSTEQDILNHRVFCFAGDGCLMEGVSSESSSIAGHLGLGNLVVLYDDNHISIAGDTALAFSEDVRKRYEAYGWRTLSVDGHDFTAIDQALAEAVSKSDKPTLIACRTIIGKGSPHKANDSEVHGSPLGAEELKLTKEALNWPLEPSFYVPDEVRKMFAARVEQLNNEYSAWQKKFGQWQEANSEKAAQLTRQISRAAPEDLTDKLIAALPTDGKPVSTRKLSNIVLQAASKEVNSLVGGSADLEPSTLTLVKGSSDVEKNQFGGLNLRFGVREHAMGAIMNGLAYYGAFTPYGSTFLVFSDYVRPSIRVAALSHLPSVFIFTHDSFFLGEDGPTHQPIEHINSLRMIPNLQVFRPADGLETAVCYSLALSRQDGPSALLFTRQNLDPFVRPAGFSTKDITRGAYSVLEPLGDKAQPEIVIIATGSEVPLALAAAKKLDGTKVRVVSMPCVELFQAQSREWREKLIPRSAKKVALEAGSTFGWESILDADSSNLLTIGINRFGASAPAKVLAEKFGFTADAVAGQIKERFIVETAKA